MPPELEELRALPQWIVWRYENTDRPKPTKVPYNPRSGYNADVTIPATWTNGDEAYATLSGQPSRFSGLGFVLTEHDPYTVIDLDKTEGNAALAEEHKKIIEAFNSYTEVSPSGKGFHIWVRGTVPKSINDRKLKIEVYSSQRYMTVTGNVCLKAPIELRQYLLDELFSDLRKRTNAEQPDFIQHCPAPEISDDEVRKFICGSEANRRYFEGEALDWSGAYHAILHAACRVSSDEAQVRRVLMASPLVLNAAPKGRVTRSQRVERLWASEYASAAAKGAQERLAEARAVEQGRQSVVGLPPQFQPTTNKPIFSMTFVTGKERAVTMEHFIDPWLPRRNVVGLYGRGETGKSTWASSLCSYASAQVSTLWVTSEEDTNHVALRFSHSGGEPNTLIVLPATPVKFDKETGKAAVTTFDVYSHLEQAILAYPTVSGFRHDRPLGIVVLDAINALVTWGKGENANDDASVKRLLSHLHSLAMNYDLTIIVLGHVNKNTGKEYAADAVTGSAAWTNSLRRAFLLYKDLLSDDYEGFIRTAKGNTGTAFAASYKTTPVYTLLKRDNGMDEVLCNITMTSEIVWGERAIAKLMNESDDEDPLYDKRKKRDEKMKSIAIHASRAIREGATTREVIASMLPTEFQPVRPRHWVKIDPILQDQFAIEISVNSHGKYEYKVRQPLSPRGVFTAIPLSL